MTVAFRSVSTIGEADASVDCLAPTGVEDGDILLALVAAKQTTGVPTITAPAGWTEIATHSIYDRSRESIYWKRAASEGASYTWSHDGSAGQTTQVSIAAYSGAVGSGSPVNIYSNTAYITEDTTLRGSGITPTVQPVMLVMLAEIYANHTVTPPAGMTEREDSYDADIGYVQYVADVRLTTTDATGDKDATLSGSDVRKHAFLVALAEEPPNGAAALAGVGALTATGVRTTFGSASLAGVGALTAAAVQTHSASVALYGVGTLAATGHDQSQYGSASLAGVGALAAIGLPTHFGAASLAGIGILTAIGARLRYGTAALAGVGTLAATGVRTRYGEAALAGIGTLTVIGVRIPPPLGNELRVLNAAGVLVGIAPASLRLRERLTGPNLLEQIQVPQDYLLDDGTTESRWWMIDQGYQLLYEGGRYLIDIPETDFEAGGTLTATSAEVELQNYDTNYSPGPATYLNRTPTQIMDAVLAGKVGRLVRNPGFGILDSSDLPTNWTHATGWTSQLVSNRRVWQADAGTDESVSDLRPCTPGISYRVAVDVKAPAGMAGTASVLIRWRLTDGTTVDSAATVASETGAFVTVETGDIVALGNKLQIVLVTTGTDQVVQFDDVRLYEIGPDTGWTYDGSMDTRAALIPFSDGAIVKYGVWTKGASDLSATAVGDYIGRVINGPFVTIGFAAGGAGAQAKIRVNGVVYTSTLDVSSATTYTVEGLDPANDHIVEVEVAAVKVAVTGFTVSTVNQISMRWDYKTVYEAVASVAKAVGGELSFDTVNKVITHASTIGVDLRATNVVDFRRGSNLVKFARRHDRTGIVNHLTGLGYGEGEYQLVVTVDATGLDADGVTSQSLYGTRRGKTANKDWKDLATAVTECQRIVEAAAFGANTYTTETTDAIASLCSPGDTAHFLYRDEEVSLRILEVQRSNDGGTATLVVGDKAEALEDVVSGTRRDLATLQRSYQGVPTDTNDSFSEQFDRTSGGTDTPAECSFFVPYGADLLDLRARYQIGGMRAFAKSVGGGGGTNTPSGGGSTSGYDGGQTSSSVGSPSGGGSTSGGTGAPSGGGSTSGAVSTPNSGDSGATGINQDDIAIVTPTRDIASNSQYAMLVPAASAATYPTQLLIVTVTNFDGSAHDITVNAHVSSSGGADHAMGTTSVAAGGTAQFSLDWSAHAGYAPYVEVQQASGTANYKFACALTGMGNHSHSHAHTIAHTHTTPDHTHPSHTHTTPDHTHPIHSHTVPSHFHTTPAHVHALPDHAHTLAYGIYESGVPATIRVYLDDALIAVLNDLTYVSDFDLLPYIGKDSNGRVQEGWHTLSFKTATASATGSVRGTVFAQKFLSVAGG
jgi:hypothetical protein